MVYKRERESYLETHEPRLKIVLAGNILQQLIDRKLKKFLYFDTKCPSAGCVLGQKNKL